MPAVSPSAVPARHRSPWPRAAILLILCLAAGLRWIEPGLVEFKYDEAHIAGQALDLARGGPLPLLSGGTTLGVQRGALDVYLLAMPLKLLGGRVEAAVWFLSALGVLAVALTYLLARKAGGISTGLLAATFMAANPWLIYFDRKLWAHIQVVFSVALLLLAWQVIVSGRRRAALCFPLLAAMQLTAHVLAILQALSWLGAFLVAPRRWLRRETALGLLAASAVLTPYLWALWQWMSSHGGAAGLLSAGLEAGQVGSAPIALAATLREAARLLTGDGLNVLAALPRSASPWWLATGALLPPLSILFGVGLLRTVWDSVRPGRGTTGARLLLAWTAGPALLLALGPLRPPLQYWTVLLPLPALYLALGCDWVVRGLTGVLVRVLKAGDGRRRTIAMGAAWGAAVVPVAVLVLVWCGSHAELLRAVDRGTGATTFGPPLKRWETAVATALMWADRLGAQEVRVAVNGVDPGYDGEAAAVAALLGSPPYARFVAPASPPAVLLANDKPSLYLWAVDSAETEAELARMGERVWEGALAGGHPLVHLYRLPPASTADLGFQRLDPPAIFDAGLALIGYALPQDGRAGQPLRATLVWRVLDPPWSVRERDMTAFNHILDAGGQGAAQADGLALLSRDWWPGDVLMQPYSLTLPAGAYRWRTGIYSRQDGGRSQLVTGGDSVELPGPIVR